MPVWDPVVRNLRYGEDGDTLTCRLTEGPVVPNLRRYDWIPRVGISSALWRDRGWVVNGGVPWLHGTRRLQETHRSNEKGVACAK